MSEEKREEEGEERRMSNCQKVDPRVHRIASSLRVVPHFPKPGIMFQDITTLLLDPKAFRDTIDIFVERYKDKHITAVAGEVLAEEYVLEYGKDRLELHVGAIEPGDRAIVVDDLIATGGTLRAAIRLLERANAEVFECACVIGMPELKGRERLGATPLYLLVELGNHLVNSIINFELLKLRALMLDENSNEKFLLWPTFKYC